MIDLAINKEDLMIVESNTENGITYYDLALEENTVGSIIVKALQTPLGYLKTSIIQNLQIDVIDEEKGNDLYELLSSPITLNWSSSIRGRIIRTVKALNIPTLSVLDIRIQLADLETALIEVTYSYLGETNNVQVTL